MTDAQTFEQDPRELLPYAIHWGTWLPEGDTLATSEWEAKTDGIDVAGSANDTTTATVWLAGGTAGRTYRVKNTVSTAAGLVAARSIYIRCRER